jgi:hypothetical protein
LPRFNRSPYLFHFRARRRDHEISWALRVHGLFERQGERADVLLDVGSVPLVERSLHLALRKDLPGAAAVVTAYNPAITEMIADGSYNQILGVTWLRADVDGDGDTELVLGGVQAGRTAPDRTYTVFKTQRKPEVSGNDGYVVAGKEYGTWEKVPPRYRVPVAYESAGESGIVLFDF